MAVLPTGVLHRYAVKPYSQAWKLSTLHGSDAVMHDRMLCSALFHARMHANHGIWTVKFVIGSLLPETLTSAVCSWLC